MLLLKLVVFALSFVLTNAAHNLCSHVYSTPSGYIANTYSSGESIPAHAGARDALIHLDSNSQLVTRSTARSDGTFPERDDSIADSTFCSGTGKIYSMDINNDHVDDLLCHESDGTFSYKIYDHYRYSVKYVLALPSGFSCASGSTIFIGNFDGLGTEDIICAPSAADFTGAQFLSPGYCSKYSRSSYRSYYRPYTNVGLHHGIYHGAAHGIYHGATHGVYHGATHGVYHGHAHGTHYIGRRHAYGYRPAYSCKSTTSFTLSSGSLSGCTPPLTVVATVNPGTDRRDDFVCRKSDHSVSYFLSSGSTASMFSGSGTTSSAGTNCDGTAEILLSADVDGDGDSDLVCVHDSAEDTVVNDISYFTGSDYSAFVTGVSQTPTCFSICSESGNTNTIDWKVGDFNGDGSDDVMCRYVATSGAVRLNFAYSEEF